MNWNFFRKTKFQKLEPEIRAGEFRTIAWVDAVSGKTFSKSRLNYFDVGWLPSIGAHVRGAFASSGKKVLHEFRVRDVYLDYAAKSAVVFVEILHPEPEAPVVKELQGNSVPVSTPYSKVIFRRVERFEVVVKTAGLDESEVWASARRELQEVLSGNADSGAVIPACPDAVFHIVGVEPILDVPA